MNGRWRVSWLHLIAFAAGLVTVLGVLVQGTIERVNQISAVTTQTVLAAADAVAAGVADDARAGAWAAVQERVRAMATQHLRIRYRAVTADGTVVADSQQIRASGRLVLPLMAAALAEDRELTAAGTRPYELLAALPLPTAGGRPAATLVVEASWERPYLELRQSIERQALLAALLLLLLVTGGFLVVWGLGVEPLQRLRAVAEAAGGGDAAVRAPRFLLADLHKIGEALNRLQERSAHERALAEQIADLAERNRRLAVEALALKDEVEALEQARDAAEAANAAKSDFLARMSHDLRTPLHGIIGFAEMIRDQLVGPLGNDKYVDYARDIHQSGVHLLRLINDVLDLSKIEAGHFELASDTIVVAAVIGESVHAVSPLAAQKGLSLSSAIAPGLPPLTGDEKTLRQMLFNLLSNAIKFTDAGGSVAVMARQKGGGLDITVSDTGMGIEAADLELVFTEYGQAGNPRSQPAEGTGLGLVIVKSLIELHGGRLTIQSEPGRGTAVTLSFPAERVCAIPAPEC